MQRHHSIKTFGTWSFEMSAMVPPPLASYTNVLGENTVFNTLSLRVIWTAEMSSSESKSNYCPEIPSDLVLRDLYQICLALHLSLLSKSVILHSH